MSLGGVIPKTDGNIDMLRPFKNLSDKLILEPFRANQLLKEAIAASITFARYYLPGCDKSKKNQNCHCPQDTCKNAGVCVVQATPDGQDDNDDYITFKCHCPTGYTGRFCGRKESTVVEITPITPIIDQNTSDSTNHTVFNYEVPITLPDGEVDSASLSNITKAIRSQNRSLHANLTVVKVEILGAHSGRQKRSSAAKIMRVYLECDPKCDDTIASSLSKKVDVSIRVSGITHKLTLDLPQIYKPSISVTLPVVPTANHLLIDSTHSELIHETSQPTTTVIFTTAQTTTFHSVTHSPSTMSSIYSSATSGITTTSTADTTINLAPLKSYILLTYNVTNTLNNSTIDKASHANITKPLRDKIVDVNFTIVNAYICSVKIGTKQLVTFNVNLTCSLTCEDKIVPALSTSLNKTINVNINGTSRSIELTIPTIRK
ncbi:unnamed protein product [Didymodactylos carnosus]|uniref:EGF-like domain-containing protein n=1 Tax=Didymodactylos carnosus TaxID=1234261 RepID=A0A8S2JTQ7_9BILA|nr:unnamed protein product [Didymodactylos carnosus]CAF3822047.1 unnamed protein product [Didymodactylos carnosus]